MLLSFCLGLNANPLLLHDFISCSGPVTLWSVSVLRAPLDIVSLHVVWMMVPSSLSIIISLQCFAAYPAKVGHTISFMIEWWINMCIRKYFEASSANICQEPGRSCWRHKYRTGGLSYLISAAMMTDSFEQRPTEYYRNEIDVIWMSANCPTFVGAAQINIFLRASNIKQTKIHFINDVTIYKTKRLFTIRAPDFFATSQWLNILHKLVEILNF